MKKTYIKTSNLPPRLPVMAAAFWFMFIQYYHLPQWVYGIWATLFGIIFIAELYRLITEDGVDVTNR